MAKHDTIAAVTRAIIQVLVNAKHTYRHDSTTLAIEAVDGKTLANRVGANQTIVTVLLYRVAVNNSVRVPPPRTAPDRGIYHPPLLLDLFYLITPWANSVDTQQSLLGWIIRTLHNSPLLTASLINDMVPADPPLRPTESVELAFDPVALQDWLGIWDKLKLDYQTSACYVARMVTIESEETSV